MQFDEKNTIERAGYYVIFISPTDQLHNRLLRGNKALARVGGG